MSILLHSAQPVQLSHVSNRKLQYRLRECFYRGPVRRPGKEGPHEDPENVSLPFCKSKANVKIQEVRASGQPTDSDHTVNLPLELEPSIMQKIRRVKVESCELVKLR